MKGIELISKERLEQLEKHEVSINNDFQFNNNGQLLKAAQRLIVDDKPLRTVISENPPPNWNKHIWRKMTAKPYKERLIIAGALIAAEIDRLQMEQDVKQLPLINN